ncbi:MAG: hypothetical protein SAK29_36095 [Scytonema sp. PMC 1069.18]|nr:hypothetical protein [Scytonema sp. PMC 1069.18]MEC4888070.1 hypothetical protein [Scytonema sp. PMC 1070.18]
MKRLFKHPLISLSKTPKDLHPPVWKAWHNKKGDPQEDGLEQLDSYLARLGVDFGWLIIFDQRSKAPPIEERLTTQITTTKNGRSVTVVRA